MKSSFYNFFWYSKLIPNEYCWIINYKFQEAFTSYKPKINFSTCSVRATPALTKFLGHQPRTNIVSACRHILLFPVLFYLLPFLIFSPSAPLHYRCTAVPVSRLLHAIWINISRITVCQHKLFNKQCKQLWFSKAFALLFCFFLFFILSFLIQQQKGQFGGCQADTSMWESSLLLLTLVASKGQQQRQWQFQNIMALVLWM